MHAGGHERTGAIPPGVAGVPLHTSLTPGVLLVVLGAGVLHAAWNAMAKSVEDRLFGFALIGVAATIGGGGALIVTGMPARAALGYVVLSTCFHILYEYGLINSYRLGAFNQTYPIARGTSPLVVAVGALLLAHEHLSGLAWTGIAVLAVGLMSLAFSAGHLNSRGPAGDRSRPGHRSCHRFLHARGRAGCEAIPRSVRVCCALVPPAGACVPDRLPRAPAPGPLA